MNGFLIRNPTFAKQTRLTSPNLSNLYFTSMHQLRLYLCSFFLFISVLFSSCTGNKKLEIDQQNVKEVLTHYGEANPESTVLISTDSGEIKITLYKDTPLHRANFIRLIKENYYDEAEFYRIIRGFAIQGGNPTNRENFLIPSEFTPTHFHKKGALAMARFNEDNPQKMSSSTEFYIVQGVVLEDWEVKQEAEIAGTTPTPAQMKAYTTIGGDISLDGKYTVFGEVTEGLEVVDKIASVPTNQQDKPKKPVFLKIKILQ